MSSEGAIVSERPRSPLLPTLLLVAAIAALVLGLMAARPCPHVVAWLSGEEEEFPLDGVIIIAFDRPMEHSSTEEAFRIIPPVQGRFLWPQPDGEVISHVPTTFASPLTTTFTSPPPPTNLPDTNLPIPHLTNLPIPNTPDTILIFAPDRLASATTYRVEIGPQARCRQFACRPLGVTAVFSFTTAADGLRVVGISPASGEMDVPVDHPIRVSFNRPVAPSDAAGEPTPLRLEPPVEGHGDWIGPDVYIFYPQEPLQPATRYTVTIPAGLRDQQGGLLAHDFRSTFVTIRPRVLGREPHNAARDVSPRTAIKVVFNQPMDISSVEAAFRLTDAAGHEVPGRFSWTGDDTLAFTPEQPLDDGATYRVSIGPEALARNRRFGLPRAESWAFTVAPRPELVSSQPPDGATDVQPRDRIVLRFNTNMDTVSVERYLNIAPQPNYVKFVWRTKRRLEIYADLRTDTEYRIMLADGIQDTFGRPLQGNRSIVFRTAPPPPLLALQGPPGYPINLGVYDAYGPQEQYLQVRNIAVITYTLSRVAVDDFIRRYKQRWAQPDPRRIPHQVIASWPQRLDLPLDRVYYITTTLGGPLGPLSPGLYLFQARAAPSRGYRRSTFQAARFVLVTGASLSLKRSARQALVWATDNRTGQPIADMDITLLRPNGEVVAQGRTDEHGIFLVSWEKPDSLDQWAYDYPLLYALGEREGHERYEWALCGSTWDMGITPYDFHLRPGYGERSSATGYVYTDRPIYRPGQTVHFKGIVRKDNDGLYSLLDADTVPVSVRDSRDTELWAEELPLSPFGTFSATLSLDETAALGQYRILATLPGRPEPLVGTFTVAAYRKPAFRVTVEPVQAHVVSGGRLTVTARAEYYFGAPVADAAVRWYIYGEEYQVSSPDGEWYSFYDYDGRYWYWGRQERGYNPPIYASGEGHTDEQGRFVFTLPIDLTRQRTSQALNIEVNVTDQDAQEVTGRAVVIAHKHALYLGLRPLRYVGAPGQPQSLRLIALSPPLEGSGVRARPGITATVEVYLRRWYTVKEKDAAGRIRWRNALSETLILTRTVTTGPAGWVDFDITLPEGGEYRVVAHTLDELGNPVRCSVYLWVWGKGFVNWGVPNDNRVTLVADKRAYQPGEVAQILIASPFADALALVTIERNGVLQHWVQPLPGTSALLEIPIQPEYAPNAFLSVTLFWPRRGDTPAQFRLGYVELAVTPTAQTLRVRVTPDKERYHPGDEATYTVEIHDYKGQPVQAEVSLALVDAAVLALVGDITPDPLSAFYHRRSLGVQNAHTLVLSVDRYNEQLEPGAKGGGGGEGEGPRVRRHFADTAFWAPAVRTDAQGRATVRLRLPDDLTTWRMQAVAVTKDTKLGTAHADVVSTKDILVRPLLPRFLVAEDEVELAALVHNYSPTTQTLQVSIETGGIEVVGKLVGGKLVDGGLVERELVVGSGEVARVSWTGVVSWTRAVTVRFTARNLANSALADAVEMRLPVHVFSTVEPLVTYEKVDIRARYVLTAGLLLPSFAPDRSTTGRVTDSAGAGRSGEP